MKLIYRAMLSEYTPRSVQPYTKPRALNWRFQVSDSKIECTPHPVQRYVKPRALNWRFQFPALT